MKHTLKHVIAATVLTACMGITYAGDAPRILGSIEYQALSQQAMAGITGQGGGALGGGGVDAGWRTNPSGNAGGMPGGEITPQAGKGGINAGGDC
jgi:hypothetical protein